MKRIWPWHINFRGRYDVCLVENNKHYQKSNKEVITLGLDKFKGLKSNDFNVNKIKFMNKSYSNQYFFTQLNICALKCQNLFGIFLASIVCSGADYELFCCHLGLICMKFGANLSLLKKGSRNMIIFFHLRKLSRFEVNFVVFLRC